MALTSFQALLGFYLQLELFRRFSDNIEYQKLLVALNVLLPVGMVLGSASGLTIAKIVGAGMSTAESRQASISTALATVFGYAKHFVGLVGIIAGIGILLQGRYHQGEIESLIGIWLCAGSIAVAASTNSAMGAIASGMGKHMLSAGLSIIPNACALAGISSLSESIGMFAYPLGWLIGAMVNGALVFLLVEARDLRRILSEGFGKTHRDYWPAVKLCPGFALFGVHQFVDGLVLGHVGLDILPLATFAQRIIVSVGSISNTGLLSLTVYEYSSQQNELIATRKKKLYKRCLGLIGAGTMVALMLSFSREVGEYLLGQVLHLGEDAHSLAKAAPLFACGTGFMLATVLMSRALLLLHERKALPVGAVIAATSYALLEYFGVKIGGIVAVGAAYLFSWIAVAAYLARVIAVARETRIRVG